MPPPRIARRASDFEGTRPLAASRSASGIPSPANESAAIWLDGTSANTSSISAGSRPASASPKRKPVDRPPPCPPAPPAHGARPLPRQPPLCLPPLRSVPHLLLQLRDLLPRQPGEELQVFHRVPVVRLNPELVEAERRRQAGIEPDRAGLRL